MFFKAIRYRTPTRCRQWRGSATCRAPGGRRRGGGGAPGRQRSAPEARIVARGAAVGGGDGGGYGAGRAPQRWQTWAAGRGGAVRAGVVARSRPLGCLPARSEAAASATPRSAGCEAPKRPMVVCPCRPPLARPVRSTAARASASTWAAAVRGGLVQSRREARAESGTVGEERV